MQLASFRATNDVVSLYVQSLITVHSNQMPRTIFFHYEISSFVSLIGCDSKLNDYFHHSHFGNKSQYLYKKQFIDHELQLDSQFSQKFTHDS